MSTYAYEVLDLPLDKNKVKHEIDDWFYWTVEREYDCSYNTPDPKYVPDPSHVFPSFDAAKHWLKKNTGKCRCWVVPYGSVAPTPQMEAVEERMNKLKSDIDNMRAKLDQLDYYYANPPQPFIGCKECGSRLASAYCKRIHKCPVCDVDMRPASIIEEETRERKKLAATCKTVERLQEDYYDLGRYAGHIVPEGYAVFVSAGSFSD